MEIFYIDSKTFLENVDKDSLKYFSEENNQKSNKRQIQYALGRFLLEFAAKKYYNIQDFELVIENKKPIFKNIPVHFSISHSENIIMIAFDTNETGLDIEVIKQRDYTKILKYMNTKIQPADKIGFYSFWTTYEAEIKLQKQANSSTTFKFLNDYVVTLVSSESFDIRSKLKIYEVTSPIQSTNPSELINLKLVNDSIKKENTVVLQEISTASLDFLPPLNLKTE